MATSSYWVERHRRVLIGLPMYGAVILISCNFLSIYLIICTYYWYIPLVYLLWMLLDINSCETGSRGFACLRKIRLPDFPFLFETSTPYQLDPDRNYLFCCYPHGPLPYGFIKDFMFDKGKFKEYFPNHKTYMTNMHASFLIPYFREMLLVFGCCSASEKSLNYLLSKPNGGNAVALILGGRDEMNYVHKKDYHIVLKRRKGFARVALKNGSPIVPVFSFGANDVYNYPQNRIRQFLEWLESRTGANLMISYGQGIFHNWYGGVPFIKPINTIVGEPIDVVKNDNPSREEIEELHAKFTNALIKLFDDHKDKYEPGGIKKLIIIE
ncbi:hypothetical protein FQR65_LT07173 [Abscondita terminalis]|nr:hypothetical protein FQR65_LT07173 [Abscondita terminalis]